MVWCITGTHTFQMKRCFPEFKFGNLAVERILKNMLVNTIPYYHFLLITTSDCPVFAKNDSNECDAEIKYFVLY